MEGYANSISTERYEHALVSENERGSLQTDVTCRFTQQIACSFESEAKYDNEFSYVALNSKITCYSLKNSIRVIDRVQKIKGSIKLNIEGEYPLISLYHGKADGQEEKFYLAIVLSTNQIGIYEIVVLPNENGGIIKSSLVSELKDVVVFHWNPLGGIDTSCNIVTITRLEGQCRLNQISIGLEPNSKEDMLWGCDDGDVGEGSLEILDSDYFCDSINVLMRRMEASEASGSDSGSDSGSSEGEEGQDSEAQDSEAKSELDFSYFIRRVHLKNIGLEGDEEAAGKGVGSFTDLPLAGLSNVFRIFRFNGKKLSDDEERDILLLNGGEGEKEMCGENYVVIVHEDSDNLGNTALTVHALDGAVQGSGEGGAPDSADGLKLKQTISLPVKDNMKFWVDPCRKIIGVTSSEEDFLLIFSSRRESGANSEYPVASVAEFNVCRPILTMKLSNEVFEDYEAHDVARTEKVIVDVVALTFDSSEVLLHHIPQFMLHGKAEEKSMILEKLSAFRVSPNPPSNPLSMFVGGVTTGFAGPAVEIANMQEVKEPKGGENTPPKAQAPVVIAEKKTPKKQRKKEAADQNAEKIFKILEKKDKPAEEEKKAKESVKAKKEEKPEGVAAPTADGSEAMNNILFKLIQSSEMGDEKSPKQNAKETHPVKIQQKSQPKPQSKTSTKANPKIQPKLQQKQVAHKAKAKTPQQQLDANANPNANEEDHLGAHGDVHGEAHREARGETHGEHPTADDSVIEAKKLPEKAPISANPKGKDDIFWYKETKRLHGILLGKLEKNIEKQQKKNASEMALKLSREMKESISLLREEQRQATEDALRNAIAGSLMPSVSKQLNAAVQEQNKLLRDVVKKSFETMLIPSIERAVREMLAQMNETIKVMLKKQVDTQGGDYSEGIENAIQSISSKTDILIKKIHQDLSKTISEQLQTVKMELETSVNRYQSGSPMFGSPMQLGSPRSALNFSTYLEMKQYDVALSMVLNSGQQSMMQMLLDSVDKKEIIPPKGHMRLSQDMLMRLMGIIADGLADFNMSVRIDWLCSAILRLEMSNNAQMTLKAIVKRIEECENMVKVDDYEKYLAFVQLAKGRLMVMQY